MNGIILPKENFWYYCIHRNYYKYTDNAIGKYIRILIKKSNKPIKQFHFVQIYLQKIYANFLNFACENNFGTKH